MAQGPIPASELEGDIRQDGFRTRYTPERDEFPTAYDVNNQNSHYANPPVFSHIYPVLPVQVQQVQNSAAKTKGGICGLTFWLAIAVIILLVLAIVEGGLLGSKVARNAFSSQSPVVEPLEQPNDDCQAFGKRYTAKVGDSGNVTQFEINCNTDFIGSDISSFYSSSLLTCLEGCTLLNFWRVANNNIWNITCAGVVYAAYVTPIGNCFLKFGDDTSVMSRAQNRSYAKVILN